MILLFVLAGCQPVQQSVEPSNRTRAGGTDVTFLVAADAHFGASGMGELNRRAIEDMNAIAGKPYPGGGGVVGQPRGVLFAGDMTDNGMAWEWKTFEELYGLTGKEGLLKYPVFEGSGNHDRLVPLIQVVPAHVRDRHGDLTYSMDWGDVHVVCLDQYPGRQNLDWLRRDLAKAGKQVPVVIYFHYSVLGPYSQWWSQSEKEAFASAIAGYNVIGIFHGHFHGCYSYRWKGIDVFNIGSPRHMWHRFLVVHVTDTRMTVGAWDWDLHQWDWFRAYDINK
jgi:cytolysin (calcineurin-like family phosphatase)